MLQTRYPDGSALRHLYYGTGHLLQSTFERDGVSYSLAEYERDHLHREISRTQGQLKELTEFDILGRITQKVSQSSQHQRYLSSVLKRQYGYDASHQLTTQRTVLNEGSQSEQREEKRYDYDLAGQIISRVTGDEQERFNYDAAGNMTESSPRRPQDDTSHNQTKHSGLYTYQYDDYGRLSTRTHLLNGEVQHYHYDAEHNVKMVTFKNSRRHDRVTYQYDALGRRIRKTCYAKNEAVPPKATYFHWQGLQLIGEHGDTDQESPSYYFYQESSYTPLARIECRPEQYLGTNQGRAQDRRLINMHKNTDIKKNIWFIFVSLYSILMILLSGVELEQYS